MQDNRAAPPVIYFSSDATKMLPHRVTDPQYKPQVSHGETIRSGMVVSAMTFISRILGFIRDQVFAIVFGAGPMMDAFIVAFKIPNFLRRLFAEGAFAQAFVPVLTEYKEKRDAAALHDLVAHVAGALGGVLLLATTLGVGAAPVLIMLFAPGFVDDAQRYDLAVAMLRFTLPYLLFISLVAYAGSILNSHGRFAVPAITPVLLNVSLIVAALFFSQRTEPPIVALAVGVLVAGVLQLLFQLPFLISLKLLPRPRWHWQHSGVQKIFKLMLPAIFGSSVAQISILLDTVLASFLVAGSVTWLYFSDRLVEFPLGVFGVALATVILPKLSRQHMQNAAKQFNQTLDKALRLGLLISLPAALGLALLATPILATLFQYGEFSARDTAMASRSTTVYALALPAFVVVKILAPGFFARQDTRTPVAIGVKALLAKMLLSIGIMVPMVAYDYPSPHVGLAAATTLFAWIHAAMLYAGLRRHAIYAPNAGWGRFALRLGTALLVLSAALSIVALNTDYWPPVNYWQRGLRLLTVIASAAALYTAVLYVSGLRLHHLRN